MKCLRQGKHCEFPKAFTNIPSCMNERRKPLFHETFYLPSQKLNAVSKLHENLKGFSARFIFIFCDFVFFVLEL